jgi:hypothetical protein
MDIMDEILASVVASQQSFSAGMKAADAHGDNARKLLVALAALDKLHTRLHNTVDDVGCATLRRIIEDARYKMAEIDNASKRGEIA